MKKLAQGFNTAAQDSNPGPLSQESEALPLGHCVLRHIFIYIQIIGYLQFYYVTLFLQFVLQFYQIF